MGMVIIQFFRVPSGNYSIKYDYIGRATKIIEDINIGASLSTNLDASLKESVIEGEEVVVSGKKIIQDDITSSTIYMGADEMSKLPVADIRDAMMLQPGVFFDPIPVLSSGVREVHAGESGSGEARYTIRGGDQEEILWMIDGSRTQSLTINARDAGGSFMNMNSLAIKKFRYFLEALVQNMETHNLVLLM